MTISIPPGVYYITADNNYNYQIRDLNKVLVGSPKYSQALFDKNVGEVSTALDAEKYSLSLGEYTFITLVADGTTGSKPGFNAPTEGNAETANKFDVGATVGDVPINLPILILGGNRVNVGGVSPIDFKPFIHKGINDVLSDKKFDVVIEGAYTTFTNNTDYFVRFDDTVSEASLGEPGADNANNTFFGSNNKPFIIGNFSEDLTASIKKTNAGDVDTYGLINVGNGDEYETEDATLFAGETIFLNGFSFTVNSDFGTLHLFDPAWGWSRNGTNFFKFVASAVTQSPDLTPVGIATGINVVGGDIATFQDATALTTYNETKGQIGFNFDALTQDTENFYGAYTRSRLREEFFNVVISAVIYTAIVPATSTFKLTLPTDDISNFWSARERGILEFGNKPVVILPNTTLVRGDPGDGADFNRQVTYNKDEITYFAAQAGVNYKLSFDGLNANTYCIIQRQLVGDDYEVTLIGTGFQVTLNKSTETILLVGNTPVRGIIAGDFMTIISNNTDEYIFIFGATGGGAAAGGAAAAAAPICFKKGTRILTDAGYKNVELLNKGDLVVTKKGPTEIDDVISYIGKKDIVPLYCLKKNRLSLGVPENDLFMSTTHAFKHNNKWLHMGCASNHGLTTEVDEDDIPYFHIVTSDYFSHTLQAEGVEVETCFTDKGDGKLMMWSCREKECVPFKYEIANANDFKRRTTLLQKPQLVLCNIKNHNEKVNKIENKILWAYNKDKKMNIPLVCNEVKL